MTFWDVITLLGLGTLGFLLIRKSYMEGRENAAFNNMLEMPTKEDMQAAPDRKYGPLPVQSVCGEEEQGVQEAGLEQGGSPTPVGMSDHLNALERKWGPK